MNIAPVQPGSQFPAAQITLPTPAQLVSRREIVTAVAALNKAEWRGQDNELTFTMDRDTRRPVIRIIDRTTKEVLEQIPAKSVLHAAANLHS
jgi:flagellar protein FlaG